VALSYLSFAPHGLREVFTTGGLPPIGQTPEQVYRATFRKVSTWYQNNSSSNGVAVTLIF
jgi:hypothetical protein